MSKFLSAFSRSILQIGGAAVGVTAANPLGPEAVAGYVFAAGGFLWSQYQATKAKRLAVAVDNAPTLPSAKEVENGLTT